MRIQLQNNTFDRSRGGVDNYLYFLARTLLKLGHRPEVLCGQVPFPVEKGGVEGIKIIRHPPFPTPKPFLPIKPLFICRKLVREIELHLSSVDLIISRFPYYAYSTTLIKDHPPIIYVQAAVRPLQIKLASGRGSWKPKMFFHIWRSQIRYIEKKSIIRSLKTVVFSRNNLDLSSRYYSIPLSHYQVIPPGVDLERFRPEGRDAALIKELNLPPDARLVLAVSRLSAEKNLENLIEAFSEITHPKTFLILVGDGPNRDYLTNLVSRLNLGGKVIFTGRRGDVERFYRSADIFVQPSKHEPFGQVILEAMASGLPVITLRRTPPDVLVASEEIIREGESGFCVPPRIQDLRERLEQLLNNPDLRRQMGGKGREICRDRFNWERHVSELLELASQLPR